MAHGFKKDIELDARMVHAATMGLFEPFCIGIGMTTEEAFSRAKWLKGQSDEYITLVSDKVVELEQKG